MWRPRVRTRSLPANPMAAAMAITMANAAWARGCFSVHRSGDANRHQSPPPCAAGGTRDGGQRPRRERLDERCLQQRPEHSRSRIQSWIVQGKVFVDGQKVVKAGTLIKPTARLEIRAEEPRFVCRAGAKLEAALEHFQVAVDGCLALDAGLSTGGFTDCLLQRGARLVYGVDVGYGQVAEKIRTHPQVVVMERTNLRHLEELVDEGQGSCRRVLVDIVTLDLSFISVLLVLDAVTNVLKPSGTLIVLIKPQFEAKREQVGKGGIIRDAKVHEQVLASVSAGIETRGFRLLGPPIESPIKGGKGNTEFLAAFQREAPTPSPPPSPPDR